MHTNNADDLTLNTVASPDGRMLQLSYSSQELTGYIFHSILGIERDDINALYNRKIKTINRFYNMDLSSLEKYNREGVIHDGDLNELRLFYKYLHIYKPTAQTLMSMTELDWLDVDKDKLKSDYQKLKVTNSGSNNNTDTVSSTNKLLSSQIDNNEDNNRGRHFTIKNFEKLSHRKSIKLHDSTVFSLKYFEKCGLSYLASGSNDRRVKIINSTSSKFKEACITLTSSDRVYDLATFEMSGKYYVATCGSNFCMDIWNYETSKVEYTLAGHTNSIWTLIAFEQQSSSLSQHSQHKYDNNNNASNYYLISGSYDKTIKVWDLSTLSCIVTLQDHRNVVRALAIYQKCADNSKNDIFLASSSDDKTIKLWDLQSKTCIKTLTGHTSSVNVIVVYYKDDISYLVSGSFEATINIWNLNTQKLETTLKGHYKSVFSLQVLWIDDHHRHSSTNTTTTTTTKRPYLASGGWDNMIRIWDLKTYTEIKKLKASSPIFSLETFYDTRKGVSHIVSGHDDGTISFWDEESKYGVVKASSSFLCFGTSCQT